MVKLGLYPDIHWRLNKNNKSSLTSLGVEVIKRKLLEEPDFKTWIASVSGSQEDQEIILQHYLEAATNVIDGYLEQIEKEGGYAKEALQKAIDGDPKYNDVGISVEIPAPTIENGSPIMQSFKLKPVEHFTLDSNNNNKATLTEEGKSYIYSKFYGDVSSRDILKSAAFPDTVMNNILESTTDKINEILEKDRDYREIVLDYQDNKLKESYIKYLPSLVFSIPLRTN